MTGGLGVWQVGWEEEADHRDAGDEVTEQEGCRGGDCA